MYKIKLMSCELHVTRVWYPVGAVCPACYPDSYPLKNGTGQAAAPAVVYVSEAMGQDVVPLLLAAANAKRLLSDITGARVSDIIKVRDQLEDALGYPVKAVQ